MKRKIINIDENKCDSCGLCVPNCHEGALQIIDGKARLISELFCDGLGACIGYCPQGAITIEEREAEPYNEYKVMERMVSKGSNTIMAHLEHLRDHGEEELLNQAVEYIRKNNIEMSNNVSNQSNEEVFDVEQQYSSSEQQTSVGCAGKCPGSASVDFTEIMNNDNDETLPDNSEQIFHKTALKQWPVKMHLINPSAGFYQNADVVLSADCVAYAMGNFHHHFLREQSLAIACPKLDSNKEVYVDKLIQLIEKSNINTLTVVMMEVSCCSGLMQLVQSALKKTNRKIPVKQAIVSIQGKLLKEEWKI